MKVKTHILVLLCSVVAVIGATLGGMLYADHKIEQAIMTSQKAYGIVREVASLNRLATEVNQAGIQRVQQQWKRKTTTLQQAIADYPGEADATTAMAHELRQLDETFNKMLTLYQNALKSEFTGDFTQARFYRLNHISVLLHTLASLADRVANRNFTRVHTLQRYRDIFLVSLGGIWLLAISAWSVTLWTGIMTPVRKLLKTIGAVSEGRLTDRVKVTGDNNELNALVLSFNTMLDRLQDLTVTRKALLDATEKERIRIGRELHDGVCQTIAAARLQLAGLETECPRHDKIQHVKTQLAQALEDIRLIVKALHPVMLDELGLASTLRWFAKENRNNIETRLYFNVEESTIPPRLRTPIFRIVQEAANNAIRHGKATTLDVQLNAADGILDLAIEDNGQGFDLKVRPTGNGLVNIRERVEAEQGEFSLDATKGRGCCIIASFPMDNVPS
mgnify:CR=1 FL=1